VAVAVLTLVMGAAFGAVRLSHRSYAAGVDVSRAAGEMRAVADFLRRQLAELAAVRADDTLPPQVFAGGPDALTFIAPAPLGLDEGGLLVYHLNIRTGGAASELLLSHDLVDPTSQEPVPSTHRELVLVRNLESASFAYFGQPDAQRPPRQWQDVWPADAGALPELLRIRLNGREGMPAWPELLLQIQPEPGA